MMVMTSQSISRHLRLRIRPLLLTGLLAALAGCGGGGSSGRPNSVDSSSAKSADLSVTKSVDNASHGEGDTVVYTVTVTNNGALNATGVSVTDALPAGLTYSSDDAVASGTSYDSASGVWSVGTLLNGQTRTLQLTTTVDGGTGGSTLTNTASVSAAQTDPVPGNNSAAVDVTVAVPTSAELAVSQSVDNASPNEEGTVVFTVTVTNDGPSDATGVSMNDVLPLGLSYVSDDAGSTGTSYSSATGVWDVGNLNNGATATLHLTATVEAGTGGSTLTNTASLGALDQVDPNAANDSAAVAVNVVAAGGQVGLLDYWQFDESGGSSYANAVSGGASASCTSCPTPVAGRISGAQEFDGTSDEVNVADDSSFDWANGDRFSIEAWFQSDGPCSVTGETVVGRRDAAGALRWSLGCAGSHAQFTLVDTTGDGAGSDLVGSADIADGQWHHVVAMRDTVTGTNRLYVDGVEDASAAVSYGGNFGGATALNIGWLNESGSDEHFAGVIDEVALHDRVLPDSEIRRHYADGTVGLQRGYQGCGVVRIMPLGDSITRHVGFRPGLYTSLVDSGMDIDFVGGVVDACDPNCGYDPDSEGHSGYTATQIASNVTTWLNQHPADVVTLHIGTNVDSSFPYPDVTQVGQLLDQIKSFDPTIPVVLARIINKARTSYTTDLSDYNQALQNLADARIAAGDRILVVDQENDAGLDYSGGTADFDAGDDLHPNASGNAKMVPVWFQGLNRFMPACVSVSPQVISTPVTGATSGGAYAYVVEATGMPAPGFSLTTAPSGMTIHPDTGRITWTAGSAGNYDVTVRVSNNQGSDTQSFTIVVN